MDASDPFESPKSLISWAREDAKEIEILSRAFFDRKPYVPVIKFDPEINKDVHKIPIQTEPPRQIRKLLHCCVSNIRHALDQATFAAVSQLDPTHTGDVYFPFARNPTDLDILLDRKGIPEEIRPVFRDLQPYPRGNDFPGGDDHFRALGKISGPNKHRTAISIGHAAGRIQFNVQNTLEELQLCTPPFWDTAKNELILAYRTPGSKPQYQINITFFIAFSDFAGENNVPVDGAIAHFIAKSEAFVAALEIKTIEILAARGS
jgi:hypothetical protein